MSDENYPTIAINVSAKPIIKQDQWAWRMKVHIEGPDTVHEFVSEPFKTKEATTLDMLNSFESKLHELLDKEV